jgi:hypothetical protein
MDGTHGRRNEYSAAEAKMCKLWTVLCTYLAALCHLMGSPRKISDGFAPSPRLPARSDRPHPRRPGACYPFQGLSQQRHLRLHGAGGEDERKRKRASLLLLGRAIVEKHLRLSTMQPF